MARYVDAEKIKFTGDTFNDKDETYVKLSDVKQAIDQTPTADVVEVVRCKDCKCCEHCYPAKAIGEEAIEGWYCKIRKKHMRPDDFCSYGERK